MRPLADAFDGQASDRQDDAWVDDGLDYGDMPSTGRAVALRDPTPVGRLKLAGRRLRLARRRRGLNPWSFLTQLFIGGAIIYGILLGGHADHLIAYVTQHGTSAAAQAGFTISRVTIEGQNRTADKDLVKALGVGGGDSILSFNTASAQQRIEALPWVREAEVMRLLPSTLHVIIAERRPYARWQLNGKTHLIDRDGNMIGDADLRRDGRLPLIVGEGAAIGYNQLVTLLSRHHTLRHKLLAAIRVADRRWTLKLREGVEILLPEERVADALDWITEADRTQGLLSRALHSIDMRLGDRVTVRLNDDAAARRKAVTAAPTEQPGRDT